MPRFRRASADDTVRAAWWDQGTLPDGTPWQEDATFKPALTEGVYLEMAILLEPRLAELQARAQEQGLSESLLKSLTVNLTGQCLLLAALDRWAFRTGPTPEQEAAGYPGDIMDLSLEALANLDRKDMQFLANALTPRIGDATAPTVSGTFQPDGPTGDSVPVKRVPRGGRAARARHQKDGDGVLRLQETA